MNIGKSFYLKERDEEALSWFQFDNYKNNEEALFYIGKIYSFDKQYEKALENLYRALDSGYQEAVREIKFIHTLHGEKTKGIKLLIKEANKGNVVAMKELGATYEMFNPDSAFYWFKRAAANNSFYGMSKLGDIYERGIGRPINLDSAYYWYNKASELGDCFSRIELARFYLYGIGVERDFAKGWTLLESAKEKCPRDAYYLMGQIYQEGIGVAVNKNKSLEYYKKALKYGALSAEWKIEELGFETATL